MLALNRNPPLSNSRFCQGRSHDRTKMGSQGAQQAACAARWIQGTRGRQGKRGLWFRLSEI